MQTVAYQKQVIDTDVCFYYTEVWTIIGTEQAGPECKHATCTGI
jgi:hypothetical protein